MQFSDLLMVAAQSGGVGVDTDVASWVAQVVTNGGTVSASRAALVSSFVRAEKAAGIYPLVDDYWGLWAENATQALTSLKQRRLATLTSVPTFTIDRGYAFDGVDDIYNTGFVPSTHAVALTVSNGRLAVYERQDVTSANGGIGCQSGTTNSFLISSRSGSGPRYRILDGNLPNPTATPSTGLGYTAASRTSPTIQKCYKNGVALADGVASGNAASLPSVSLYIGGINGIAQFRQTSPGFACIGAQLDATQEAAQYANVLAWATALGANV